MMNKRKAIKARMERLTDDELLRWSEEGATDDELRVVANLLRARINRIKRMTIKIEDLREKMNDLLCHLRRGAGAKEVKNDHE